MIQTSKLSKSFGRLLAVDQVSLHVKEGIIFGLVGPDGAGKTTLMRMLCDLIRPDSGEVLLTDLPPTRVGKTVYGYMPQKFSLYGDLTVRENIFFFGSLYGLPKDLIDSRAEQILRITNLAPFKDRLADQLSGGMKQKLGLTCTLITRPRILILDEPTYGVDPESRKEFWKILYTLNRQGMTIMVSTPYMDEAELCHQVAFMNQGQLVMEGTPAALKGLYTDRVFEVRTNSRDPHCFEALPGIIETSFYGYKHILLVEDPDFDADNLYHYASERDTIVFTVKRVSPSMEEVFAFLVES